MELSSSLLHWLANQGKASPQIIHEELCRMNSDSTSEEVATEERHFEQMVKFTCERIKELCLKKIGQEQAEQLVKDEYPWLTEKAFVTLWYHSQWVFDKSY